MISLHRKTEQRGGGTNRLERQFGSFMLSAGMAIIGILGMNSVCLAQADTWITKADMPTARFGLSASVVNGKIYAIGGATVNGAPALATVEEYDPVTDTWKSKTNMPTARYFLTTSAVDRTIYAIGGGPRFVSGSVDPLTTVEAYDPAANKWMTKADMPTLRGAMKSAVANGKIYVIGGISTVFSPLSVVEEYDPTTNTWARKAGMPTPRWSFAIGVVDGIIYAIGGQAVGGGWMRTMEAYDPVTDTWTPWNLKPPIPTGRTHFSAGAVNGIIYAIGGGTTPGISLSTVEAYDPATNTWTKKTDMPTARADFGIGAVNGKIYVIGGAKAWGGTFLMTVEEYNTGFGASVEDNVTDIPTSFVLYQNHPNPFLSGAKSRSAGNPGTRIRYEVSKPARVVLQVMNLLGQEVRTLVDEHTPAGFNEVIWDGRDNKGRRVPSGVYLYRMEAQGVVMTRKMVMVQ